MTGALQKLLLEHQTGLNTTERIRVVIGEEEYVHQVKFTALCHSEVCS
jgi:hypothetical protein